MSAHIDLSHKIHVLTKKEELDGLPTRDKVLVVLDVLFATTTIVAALAHGASEVVPVTDENAARSLAGQHTPGSFVLSGELHARTLPGFVEPTPLALVSHGVRGKTLIYSTTNGTIALTRTEAAGARTYCGALLNARAIAEHIVARHSEDMIVIVCAGSGNNFNLEDFYGAGYLVERFANLLGANPDLSDAARAAWALYRASRVPDALLECRVGRMMAARGLQREVEFACRFDAFPVIPVLEDGSLRLLAPGAYRWS